MKKILLAVASVTITLTASAQLYVGVNAGYGLGGPREVLGTTTNTGSGTEENIYGTLGGGLNFGVTPGYWFNEHVGAELGINYFIGSKIEASKTTTSAGEYTVTAYSNQLRLLPQIVLKSGSEEFNLYTKFGFVLPVVGKTIREDDDTGAAGPGTASFAKSETVGKMALGYTGSLGFNLLLSEGVDFFAELSAVSLRISANKTTITEYTANGSDQLGNLPTYAKEVNYVDEINSSSNTGPNANANEAEDRLRINRNYSGIFLNIGLRFTF